MNEKTLSKCIIKTLWKKGREPQRLSVYIYSYGSPRRYKWESAYIIDTGICGADESFKNYNNYVRTPIQKGRDSDIYILEIEYYNTKGEVTRHLRSDWSGNSRSKVTMYNVRV